MYVCASLGATGAADEQSGRLLRALVSARSDGIAAHVLAMQARSRSPTIAACYHLRLATAIPACHHNVMAIRARHRLASAICARRHLRWRGSVARLVPVCRRDKDTHSRVRCAGLPDLLCLVALCLAGPLIYSTTTTTAQGFRLWVHDTVTQKLRLRVMLQQEAGREAQARACMRGCYATVL